MFTERTELANTIETEREFFREVLNLALEVVLREKYPEIKLPTLQSTAPISLSDENFAEDPHEWVRSIATGITNQWRVDVTTEEFVEATQPSLGVKVKTGRVFSFSKFKPIFTPAYDVVVDGVSSAAVRWTQQGVDVRGLNDEQALEYHSVMTELVVRIAGGIVASDGIQRQGASAGYFIKRTILERSPYTKEISAGNRIKNPLVRVY